jgi:hypothetical protein
MDQQLKFNIMRYATLKSSTASDKIAREYVAAQQQLNSETAARGAILSGPVAQKAIFLAADTLKAHVIARAEALMEAYELYGAPLEESILTEARETTAIQIEHAVNALAANPKLYVLASGRTQEQLREYIRGQVIARTGGFLNELVCDFERRKIIPKITKDSGKSAAGNITNNIYHLSGAGSRVNINSTDQSVNYINISQQELFTRLRELIDKQSDEADRAEIHRKLIALEQAHESNVWDRFKDFMVAGTKITKDLAPYIPAISDWIHKLVA